MIAPIKCPKRKSKTTSWHHAFLELLPTIRRTAQHSFRSLPYEERQEMVQEVVANCVRAYRRLVELGKQDLAYASALARFGVAQVCSGRRVGGRIGTRDLLSKYAQLSKSFRVERLDQFDPLEHRWQEIVVEDKRATAADIVACRIDFASWLNLLSRRQRKVALTLATGETTSAAAKKFGLTAARISQLRRLLKESWDRFQGEAIPRGAQLAEAGRSDR